MKGMGSSRVYEGGRSSRQLVGRPAKEKKPDSLQVADEYIALRDAQIENHFTSISSALPGEDHPTDEAVIEIARDEVATARKAYAGSLASRHAGVIFKTGGELEAGLKKTSFEVNDADKVLSENTRFQYEVALGVLRRSTEWKHDRLLTGAAEGEFKHMEAARKAATLKELFGDKKDTDGSEGELFKLARAVRDHRLVKSGFFEFEGDKPVSKKDGGKFKSSLRHRRKKVYELWNKWSEEGRKGKLKQAAALGTGSLAVGASLGIGGAAIGIAGASAGAAAVGTGSLISRAGRAIGVSRLYKGAALLKAEEETEVIYQQLKSLKRQLYRDVESFRPDSFFGNRLAETSLLEEHFDHAAKERLRANQKRAFLGALAVGGATMAAFGAAEAITSKNNVIKLPRVELPAAPRPQSLPEVSGELNQRPPEELIKPADPSTGSAAPLPEPRYERLKAGDNLWVIAHEQLKSHDYQHDPHQVAEYVHRLQVLNDIDDEEAENLPTGYRLKLSRLAKKTA